MKKNFYSLLFKVLFPIWMLWQFSWHLLFQHAIDYQQTNIAQLITIKLAAESLYFFIAIAGLCYTSDKLSLTKQSILTVILGLGIYTFLQCLMEI